MSVSGCTFPIPRFSASHMWALPSGHSSRPDELKWVQAGAKVALDLASFEVVRAHLPELLELLRSSSIDVCFCNKALPICPH